ncbi:hypothetical protein MBANPS3_012269 [Mucor bainieri]
MSRPEKLFVGITQVVGQPHLHSDTAHLEDDQVATRLWRDDYYYENLSVDVDNPDEMESVIAAYIHGIQWVIQYCYQGLPSWQWYYPHHYAPLVSDLTNLTRFQGHAFTHGRPSVLSEYHSSVLTPSGQDFLPREWQYLMMDPDSDTTDWYRTDFKCDDFGRPLDEATVLILIIDPNCLRTAMENGPPYVTDHEVAAKVGVTQNALNRLASKLLVDTGRGQVNVGLAFKRSKTESVLMDTLAKKAMVNDVLKVIEYRVHDTPKLTTQLFDRDHVQGSGSRVVSLVDIWIRRQDIPSLDDH